MGLMQLANAEAFQRKAVERHNLLLEAAFFKRQTTSYVGLVEKTKLRLCFFQDHS